MTNVIPPPPFPEGPPQVTYGLLIDLLDHAEEICSNNPVLCLKHILTTWFEHLYPSANKITHPSRFEETVRRVAAPARSSIRGGQKLEGEELDFYRHKVWVPHFGLKKETSKGTVSK